MSMISDPESWMGLRSARALEGETAPPPQPAASYEPAPGGGVRGGLIRRILALFRRG